MNRNPKHGLAIMAVPLSRSLSLKNTVKEQEETEFEESDGLPARDGEFPATQVGRTAR